MKYSAYLGSALSERLEKLQSDAATILSLRDELAVMHDIAGQALQLYELACEKLKDTNGDVEKSIRLRSMASGYVIEALNQVRDMTLAAHKISESGAGRSVDVSIVHALVSQLMSILDGEIRARNGFDSHGLLDSVAERVRSELLTVDGLASRTKLTASNLDAEVRDMIESVPLTQPTSREGAA